ncbi:hypothetical protein B8A40_07415 [Dolosigranulum pigrum]|nr:hypothetical protein B8A40_07415 [Dolosigranulum pigrum]
MILINPVVAVILEIGLHYIFMTIAFIYLFNIEKKSIIRLFLLGTLFWLLSLFLGGYLRIGNLSMVLYGIVIYRYFLNDRANRKRELIHILLFVLIKGSVEFLTALPINLLALGHLHNHVVVFLLASIVDVGLSVTVYKQVIKYFKNITLSPYETDILRHVLLGYNLALVFYFGYMQHQALYFDLLVFTSVVLVGNGIVVGLVVFYVLRYSETKTREEAISKRLDYMVKYTNIIEENQLELKRFKHDYQNLLLSLSILAEAGDLDKIKQKTASLRQYSAQQLLKEYTQYSDLARIHHTLLKSILIAKLTELHHMNIVFRFVCPEPVESLNIADFDLIRMVGILIDNAREHVKDMEDGMIAVSVHKTTHGTHIKIENTYANQVTSIATLMTPGYSSKDDHSGLGLSNVEKIKNKYDHVFLNYHIDDKFEVTLIIMNEEGEY